MAMNILLLEDRGAIVVTLMPLLESRGYVVFDAFNPSDANGFIRGEEGTDIDAIILDLNLPTDGLDKQTEIPKTNYGMFSGWVWFLNHVYPDKPDMLERTIIYSAYLDDLKEYLGNKPEKEDLELIGKMKQVKKRAGASSPVEQLLNYLKIIERSLG